MVSFFIISVNTSTKSLATPTQSIDIDNSHRVLYTKAIEALRTSDKKSFEKNKQAIKSYPLYPYLIYFELEKNFSLVSDNQVKNFLAYYSDIPISQTLLTRWLYWLAKTDQQRRFLAFYDQRNDNALSCYYNSALIKIGKLDNIAHQKIIKDTKRLWLVGHSQSKFCDPLFNWLDNQNLITDELRWKRVQLSMNKNNTQLANYLSKQLSPTKKEQFAFWKKVHNNPKVYLKSKRLKPDNDFNRKVIIHGINRYSGKSTDEAYQHWEKINHQYSFSQEEKFSLARDLALKLAYQYHPKAYQKLSNLPIEAHNKQVTIWRIRTSIRAQNWHDVLSSIQALPDDEKQSNAWQYWLARSLEKTKQKEQANKIYKQLAQKRSYYGFISADALELAYQVNHMPLTKNQKAYDDIVNYPSIIRAKELNYHKHYIHAKREWYHAVKIMDSQQQKSAAQFAHDLGWHAQAIETIAKSKYLDDLGIRFPTPFETPIAWFSKSNNIESSWVYSIMRRESAFNTYAESRSGAKGLMQLMPATAKYIGKKMNFSSSNYTDLYNPKKNIRLGTAYLNYLKKRFKGNQLLATAAYNAGPNRVAKWRPLLDELPTDAWIDTIPYKETRNYVKAVLAYQVVFEWKFGNTNARIKDQFIVLNKQEELTEEG